MDEKLRILLCEDDENLGMLLREYLQAKGYSAELYPDGEAGYKAFLKNKYDLCVFDVMMPKKDGFTLAQEVRAANAEIPIIFLTAKTLKEDILEGFKIGADDYITKPYTLSVLLAKVKAVLKRCARTVETGPLRIADVEIDLSAHKVTVGGKPVKLKEMEFRLLVYLAQNLGRVVTKEELLENVWPDPYVGEGTLSVHIRHLREKIEKDPNHPLLILTVWGTGYRMENGECDD